MPRKRRQPKARIPAGLVEISGCERSLWQTSGPILASDGAVLRDQSLYNLWPSWEAWAVFYGSVRDELFRDRPWRREASAAERLYDTYLRGDDAEAAREQIGAAARATDPRHLLVN
jgi:hypothetical protein